LSSLFKDIIHFFKENVIPISILTLIIEFPFIIVDNLEIIAENPIIINTVVTMIGLAFALVVMPFSTGAQITLYSQIVNGPELDLKKCISETEATKPF
jgi:hypothetical protein